MDRKAVSAGGICQTVILGLLVVSSLPLESGLASFVVGGLVAGWYSDSFEEEYVDGAAAAVLGLGLSLGFLVADSWFMFPSLPLNYQIDFAFITLMRGAMVAIAVVPIAGIVGSVTGHVAAQLKRAYVPSAA